MDTPSLVLLLAGSTVAGLVNALAGGGSLVTLPILLGLGLPPATAAATNAVAAWLGLFGGALGVRRDLAGLGRGLAGFFAVSLIGGALGGAAMLATPRPLLAAAMPWMILAATLLYLAAPLATRDAATPDWRPHRLADAASWRGAVHGLVSVVTGYFNPAGGVAMVAAFQAFGVADLRLATALKIVLAIAVTGASVAVFVLAGAVDWPIAAIMVVGTAAGGRLGAALVRVVDGRWLRRLVLGWGGAVSMVLLLPVFVK